MSENFVMVAPGLTGSLTEDGCILWNGTLKYDGYGYTKVKGELVTVHRLALEAHLGRSIKEDFCACHHCDVRHCINPLHLFEGTHTDNMRDAVRKGRVESRQNRKLANLSDAAEGSEYVIVPPGLLGRITDFGCIIWPGASGTNGYGYKSIKRIVVSVHRASLAAKLGRPIQEGYCACHACDNRLCINPDHLWEGTQSENIKDAVRKGRLKVFEAGNVPTNHKLTKEQVEEIRQQLSAGATRVHLASEYGVSRALIHKIEYYIGGQQDGVPPDLPKPSHCTKKKLNDQQVAEIKQRLAEGETQTNLSEEYGVSRRLIYNIKQGSS